MKLKSNIAIWKINFLIVNIATTAFLLFFTYNHVIRFTSRKHRKAIYWNCWKWKRIQKAVPGLASKIQPL